MYTMIEIKDLTLEFDGHKLYDRFGMSIRKGEKVTLAGESGTGKTTFIHLLLGFVPFEKGEIQIMGQPLHADNIEQIRSSTAYVPQELHLPMTTAGELFYMPFSFRQNRARHPGKKAIQKIFDALGLSTALLGKNLDEVSGGQKQRIAIASALLLEKPLLILDEPTSSLDSRSIERLANLVFNQEKRTVLSTSHNPLWAKHADRTYNLDDHGANA
ncbi:MAG: ATP-binding cassette domain-containing protein [Bacteroidales bacterium]|nr:ATP-binding cassette domain-containing protein [Bacteroidales bacterium]